MTRPGAVADMVGQSVLAHLAEWSSCSDLGTAWMRGEILRCRQRLLMGQMDDLNQATLRKIPGWSVAEVSGVFPPILPADAGSRGEHAEGDLFTKGASPGPGRTPWWTYVIPCTQRTITSWRE